MKSKTNVYLKFRLYLLRRILIILSLPFFINACRNVSKTADSRKTYQPRPVISKSDTLASDSVIPVEPQVQPVYYNPTIQVDYGPIYYEPYPVTEYGVVHPDNLPED